MAKIKKLFICQACGGQHNKWQGQCMHCGEWDTLVEEVVAPKSRHESSHYAGTTSVVTKLNEVETEHVSRLQTGIQELDHVLGGGLVSDSVVLLGGDPGIGKSTLLLQLLCYLSEKQSVLYVSGEESLSQIAMRAERLGLNPDNVDVMAETNVERMIDTGVNLKPRVMVIDSIQTCFSADVTSAPGSVSQVRESAAKLVRFAKEHGVGLVLVGHVTKEGTLAGPRVLEHMVDTVLYFEGQSDSRYRMLRAVKNRFGAVNELGIFAMTDKGLREVSNPSAIFLSGDNRDPIPGSAVTVCWEGTRPLLAEVQALANDSHLGNPRRLAVGLDNNRLAMLLAVLSRHAGTMTHSQDIFVNLVGGLKITETAIDLPLLMAVVSSIKNKALPSGLIVFGEVGLSGEIRPVPYGPERLKEAAKHGFTNAIVPGGNKAKAPAGVTVHAVQRLDQALMLMQDVVLDPLT